MTVEQGKATMEVEARLVDDWHELPNRPEQVAYVCPVCHRQAAGSKAEPHMHSCGAWITIGTKDTESEKG